MRPRPLVHGTVDAYSNHGCRCEPCRTAGSEYARSRRTLCPGGCGRLVYGRFRPDRLCIKCTGEKKRKPLVHGTETAYANHRCRCDECRTAASAARRARKK